MGRNLSDHYTPETVPILKLGWTKLPAFIVDELMPLAPGIPASFWKFLIVVWREVMGQRHLCSKTMNQFHVTKNTARRWTAALSVSHLFNVHYGKRHKPNEPGIPTMISYRTKSTPDEWVCFISALRDTVIADRGEHEGDVDYFARLEKEGVIMRDANGTPTRLAALEQESCAAG